MLEGEKCFLEQFVKHDTDERNPASVDFRIAVYSIAHRIPGTISVHLPTEINQMQVSIPYMDIHGSFGVYRPIVYLESTQILSPLSPQVRRLHALTLHMPEMTRSYKMQVEFGLGHVSMRPQAGGGGGD